MSNAFFTQWLTLFGAPNCMIVDNATTFFLLFDTLQQKFGTIIQASSAYHSRSHGQVERVHRTIRERIIAVCASQGMTWLEGLPTVLASIRFTVNSNGISPYELVFGSPAPLAMHRVDKPSTGRWSSQLLKNTRDNLVRKLKQVLRTTTKHVPKPQFKTGDWVKFPHFHQAGPKNGNFSGPYCVLGLDLRGNVFLSNGMVRHMSQIVKTPIPAHTSAQVLSMLDLMQATGNSYYIDTEGLIQIIPEDRVDMLQQSMPTLLPTQGKGHGLTVFDNPTINKLLASKPGQVHFAPTKTTYSHSGTIQDGHPLNGSPPSPGSPVFTQPGFSCNTTPSQSLPNPVSCPSHQNLENYSGGTDSNNSRMRTRSRTQSSDTHSRKQVETPGEPTGSSRAPRYRTRKRRKR